MREVKLLPLIFASCLFVVVAAQDDDWTDPEAVAVRASTRAVQAMGEATFNEYRHFDTWSYEGGGIVRGLWEIQDLYPSSVDLEPFLHAHLNFFLTDQTQFGYRILHNVSLDSDGQALIRPWFFTIGDRLGLFPIVYADRLKYATDSTAFVERDDLYVISETVEKYIYGYPYHLEVDGTISRPLTWASEGYFDSTGEALWVDDSFMGTALLLDYGLLTDDPAHVREAAEQITHLFAYLSADGLPLLHGYNRNTDHLSCCRWARGNGWALMASSEALLAMEQMGVNATEDELYQELLHDYLLHARQLIQAQAEDGLWPNILDDPATYSETSASAMFLLGFLRGVEAGWFDQENGEAEDFAEAARTAWNALAHRVLEDGSVTGIQPGTAIQDTAQGYQPDDTDYVHCSPGLGAVLRATAAVGRFLDSGETFDQGNSASVLELLPNKFALFASFFALLLV